MAQMQTLKNMALYGLVTQIKKLPPLLLEHLLSISLREIRKEIKEEVTDEIEEEIIERIYQELENDLPTVVRAEIISQQTEKCGLYSYYSPNHNASDRVIQLGAEIASSTTDLHKAEIYIPPSTDDSDSEGSSGDYDYPEEED